MAAVKDMAASSARVTRAALDHLLRRSVRPEMARTVRRLAEELARGLGFASGPELFRYRRLSMIGRLVGWWMDGTVHRLINYFDIFEEALVRWLIVGH